MPRALSMQRTVVPPGDRAKFLERVKAREAHYTSVGCQFWLFVEGALPGACIVVTEAPDITTLKPAHATALEPPLDPARIYARLELS